MLSLKWTGDDWYKSCFGSGLSDAALERTRMRLSKEKLSDSSRELTERSFSHKSQIKNRGSSKSLFPAINHKQLFSPCLGLGTCRSIPISNTKKSIVRDLAPQDMKYVPLEKKEVIEKPPAEQTFDELMRNYCGISTTERELKQYCLPVPDYDIPDTAYEENADLIRYRTTMVFPPVGNYHLVGRLWDRGQLRKNHFCEDPDCLQQINRARKSSISLSRRDSIKQKKSSLSKEEFSMADHCKASHVPGYSGYIPIQPTESCYDPRIYQHYNPTSQDTFRLFPSDVYANISKKYHLRDDLRRIFTHVQRPTNVFPSSSGELSEENKKSLL